MVINGINGQAAHVTADNQVSVLATTRTSMHTLSETGITWAITGKITAADATDNVIFHFRNTSDKVFDVHSIELSASSAGTGAVEYGRTYSSGGGTAKTLAQFNTLSGKIQSQTSYLANDIILTGTGTDVANNRVAANTVTSLLNHNASLYIQPSATFSVRFQADAGTPTITLNITMHGQPPWEVEA